MSQKYLQLVGLAHRARKVVLGEQAIVQGIQQRKVHLVLVASDIGDQTRKKITDKCNFYDTPYIVVDDRVTLSNAIGSSRRVAVAIMDKGFANKLKTLLKV